MKRIAMVILAVAVMGGFAFGCEKAAMDAAQPGEASESKTAETGPEGFTAATVTSGDKSWTVEVARTEEERRAGLSGRESMPSNFGMWFIFPDPPGVVQDPFWMKGMNYDLDMIFVGPDMKIVDIKSGEKNQPEAFITPVAPYLYVLEVNAGEAASLSVGDAVQASVGPAQ